jgi:uncharacterized metal-binding protein YceD (DUF177 family)
MCTVSLADLSDEARPFRFRVPRERPLFEIPLGEFADDLSIRGTVTRRDEDFFVVHVDARTRISAPCRRCLEPCVNEVHFEKDLYVKRQADRADEGKPDDDYLVLDLNAREVDLRETIRELLLLDVPAYPLCRDECRGLCPSCGKNLNEGDCGCREEAIDPRWDALRGLSGLTRNETERNQRKD